MTGDLGPQFCITGVCEDRLLFFWRLLQSLTIADNDGMVDNSRITITDNSGVTITDNSGIMITDNSGIIITDISGITITDISGITITDNSGVTITDNSGVTTTDNSGIIINDDNGITIIDNSERVLQSTAWCWVLQDSAGAPVLLCHSATGQAMAVSTVTVGSCPRGDNGEDCGPSV